VNAPDRIKSKAARLQRIERRLYNAPQGLSVTQLAGDCGVNRRTIYRDLHALDEMGVPIWEHQGRFGIDRATYLSTVRLNLYESLALYFAVRLLTHHSDEHNPHIVSALDKLAAGLPDETIAAHIAQAADQIRSRPLRTAYIRTLERLTRAWADRRLIRLQYQTLNREITERVLAPYFIEVSRSTPAAYVIGFDHLRQAIRTFKIERITDAELLDQPYRIPPDFDPYDFLARAWGVMDDADVQIRLRFNPTAAPRVRESVWHASQHMEDLPDGSCELSLHIGGTREILPWILGWGADVEVLAPNELRREVADHGRRMRMLYPE
jgi:predicted DNA-binding transcriptional regulator YafY